VGFGFLIIDYYDKLNFTFYADIPTYILSTSQNLTESILHTCMFQSCKQTANRKE